MSGLPSPTLIYRYWGDGPCGEGIVGDGPPIHKVNEVTAHTYRSGLGVCVTGRMRRKDGHPGPSRSLEIDLDYEQPAWLAEVIEDARRRLR